MGGSRDNAGAAVTRVYCSGTIVYSVTAGGFEVNSIGDIDPRPLNRGWFWIAS